MVGGSGKDVGKTALVCGIISALREFAWTAVKIAGHDYQTANSVADPSEPRNQTIHEETTAGAATDTARYLAAGARRALLVTRKGADVPIEDLRRALGSDPNIIYESNRIVDVLTPDVCIALAVAGAIGDTKASFTRLLDVADVLVTVGDPGEIASVPKGIPRFHLQSLESISLEMANWLRDRLLPIPEPASS